MLVPALAHKETELENADPGHTPRPHAIAPPPPGSLCKGPGSLWHCAHRGRDWDTHRAVCPVPSSALDTNPPTPFALWILSSHRTDGEQARWDRLPWHRARWRPAKVAGWVQSPSSRPRCPPVSHRLLRATRCQRQGLAPWEGGRAEGPMALRPPWQRAVPAASRRGYSPRDLTDTAAAPPMACASAGVSHRPPTSGSLLRPPGTQ